MKNLLFLTLTFTSYLASAVDPSPVQKTQDALRSPQKRSELLKDEKAQATDKAALGVVGSQKNLDEMYDIAAEILPVLMDMNQGDPEKAAQSLEEFKKDPEKFISRIPASSQEKIRALAQKVGMSMSQTTTITVSKNLISH